MDGPRAVKKDELQATIDLLNEVFRSSHNREKNMGEYFGYVFNEDNLHNMRIFSDQGKPVGHIGYLMSEISIYGCCVGAGSIGAVCTLEEYRGQKIASALLEDVITGIEEQGGDIMIVSGSRGLYKRAGCIESGTGCRFMILKGYTGRIHGQNISITPCSDASLLAPLHEEEAVRFVRPLELFQKMVNTNAVMDRAGEVLLICDEKEPLAYAALILPGEEKKVASVVEYGGSKRALLDAVVLIFEKYDLNGLTFDVAGWDKELIYLLEGAVGKPEYTYVPGTVKLLNLVRLAKRIQPLIISRVGTERARALTFAQEGEAFTFSDGSEDIVLRGPEAVQLIFGKKENDQLLEIPEGNLRRTLEQIFPLPRPWAGFNFV